MHHEAVESGEECLRKSWCSRQRVGRTPYHAAGSGTRGRDQQYLISPTIESRIKHHIEDRGIARARIVQATIRINHDLAEGHGSGGGCRIGRTKDSPQGQWGDGVAERVARGSANGG